MKKLKQFLNREIETIDFIVIILMAGFSCLASYLGNRYIIGFFLIVIILSILKSRKNNNENTKR